MKESMIFVYISANCIQHEFFIHFFFLAVVELSELFVFFYIPKMSFCLDRPGLTVDDPFSALDIYMRFCLQFLPSFIDLHYFVFVLVLIRIVFIKTFFFVFTSSAVCTSVYLKCLAVSLLLSLFCPDMMKLSSVVADILLLSLGLFTDHVVMLTDIFTVCFCLPFFVILQFDIAGDSFLFQI